MGNKSKNNKYISHEKPKPSIVQDYDLTQSLNKVRQYSRHTKKNTDRERTFSDESQQYQGRREFVSNTTQYEDRTTGTPSWDRYDRLEDRFTSYSDKNEREHTALRQELEGKIEKSSDGIKDEIKGLSQKIDKKISKWFFGVAISTLVAIVGIIWTLSYQEVAKVPAELIKIDGRVEKVEHELKEQKQLVDSISKNVKPMPKSKK